MSHVEQLAANPEYLDKNGAIYSSAKLMKAMSLDYLDSPYDFLTLRGIEVMPEQTKKTTHLIDTHVEQVSESLNRLIQLEGKLSESTKSVSSKVRKSTDDLKNGLERIHKQADFNSLERYVALLERASTAIETLAKIQETGKLEKIGAALR